MIQSSLQKRPQENSGLPANLNSHNGFGSGFRFHYDDRTQQSEWKKHKYRGFQGQERAEHQEIREPLARRIVANDETSLTAYDRLAFATEISIRYHHRRHTHYERAFRIMMLAVIMLASFAFTSGVNERLFLGLTIIGLSAGTLFWNVTQNARLHDVLRNEYQNLLEHLRLSPQPDQKDIRGWRTLRLRIQSKEPPVYWAVANECYYDVARAWDLEPRTRHKLPAMLRPFMNWFRF